jgi:hypothetical protein
LCLSSTTPLVRYLDVSQPPRQLAVSPPLRVLVMISSPPDDEYGVLDVEQEWAKLREALADLVSRGQVVLERLEAATLTSLQRRLRSGGDCHVFHFIGHGGFDPDLGDGLLICEDEAGHAREVRGEQLGALLSDHYPMRLAVLNACEGARGDITDPFAGTAQSLIQQKLPAVVAMQFEITDKAAIVFAHELYAALADGCPLEEALTEARKAIRNQVSEVEWATPVLYLRAPDGRIFDIPPASSPAPSKAPKHVATNGERETAPSLDGAAVVVRHNRVVNAVAFGPDGRWLATGGNDGSACIWHAAGGRQRLSLPHRAAVNSVVFSPDGRWLATGGDDATARIWDAASIEERLSLPHRAAVNSVVFSPDGRWLATGGDDGSARIWDAASGRERISIGRSRDSLFGAVFGAHLGPVLSVSFSHDGRWLATGCGHAAYVWDPVSARKRAFLRHGSAVSSVVFSPDGRWLATGSDDGSVRIWDVAGGEERLSLPHKAAVTSVAFSPDGRWLATGGNDGFARIWDAARGGEHIIVRHKARYRVTSVAFSPDGRWLAAGGSDCTARIWPLE